MGIIYSRSAAFTDLNLFVNILIMNFAYYSTIF